MLTWRSDECFVVGETTFHSLPPGVFAPVMGLDEAEDKFFIAKPRRLVERHAALLGRLQPQQIVELGVARGGSTMFLAEIARPRRIVGIDRESLQPTVGRVESHAASRGMSGVIRIYDEVDQQDRPRLAAIVDEEFEGAPLDLVVDDCSHLYEPTRASFSELFPRLRPGGAYVIDAWPWAHAPIGSELSEGLFPNQMPLTQLLFEIVLAVPGIPGLIADVSIGGQLAVIWRGQASVDPVTFEISASSNPRGRELLTASHGSPKSPQEPAQGTPVGPVRAGDPYALLADLPRLHHWGGEAQVGGMNSEIGERIINELKGYDAPRVLETGAGASTLLFCCLEPGDVTSIAPDEGLRESLLADAAKRDIEVDRLRFLCERSEIALPRLAADDERFDIALIDGSHNWPSVFVDFCYMNMMMPAGGTLFVDDVQLFSVWQLYLLLLKQEEFEFVALDGKFATFRKIANTRFLPEWNSEAYITQNSPVETPEPE